MPPDPTTPELEDRWKQLTATGAVVSIAHGKCDPFGRLWSVHILHPDGTCNDKPFAAKSLQHAVEIAEIEIAMKEKRN